MKLISLSTIFFILAANIAFAGDTIVGYSEDDPEMNTAIENAVSTLDQFLVLFEDNQDDPDFGLKVAFDINSGDEFTSEIIWVSPVIRLNDTQFTGLLANEPNWMEGLHFGDQVTFTKEMIADWFIKEDGKNYGYYTIRVLVDRLSKDQATHVRSIMHKEILPPYFYD